MILRKLKRLLGLGSGDDGGRAERDVTMQERGDADAGNEAAVKGVDDADDADDAEAGTAEEPASADEGGEESVADEGDDPTDESATEEAADPTEDGSDESTTGEAAESTDAGSDESATEETADEVDEPVAAETDADASTESLVDEEIAQEEPAGRAEPAEAAGPESDDETTDVESTDVAVEEEEPTEVADDSPPVDEIRGIGPAYSERLGEIGIDTVADLVDADAAEVAERTTAPEKTVRKWIDRASDHE